MLNPLHEEQCVGFSDIRFPRSVSAHSAAKVEIPAAGEKRLPSPSTRVAIKSKGRILLIDPNDVVLVKAQGNYVLLQCESASYLLRELISAMAEKLEPYGFVRIHRSMLVNRYFVREIQPYLTGEYGLRVKDGNEYIVTRTYKKNLKLLAELWIGSDTVLAE